MIFLMFLLAITGVNVFCVLRFFVVVLRLVRDLHVYHKLCPFREES